MKKALISVVGLLVVATAITAGVYRYRYPYGYRTCFMPCLLGALRIYAEEHDGRFPDGTNSIDALIKLAPQYTGESTDLLAGITGDRKKFRERLRRGQRLGTNDSSWVYRRGLSVTDAPDLILVYESKSGFAWNGRRSRGRLVGFVSGDFRQVSEDEFKELIKSWN